MRDKNVRLADWAGPTKAHRIRPKIQNALAPRSRVANRAIAHTLMPMSEVTITGLGPSRSSRRPDETVAIPAMTFAAMPNTSTSVVDSPNATCPITPPKVKTPVRPSRKIALASRNLIVFGLARQMLAMLRNSTP